MLNITAKAGYRLVAVKFYVFAAGQRKDTVLKDTGHIAEYPSAQAPAYRLHAIGYAGQSSYAFTLTFGPHGNVQHHLTARRIHS